MDRLRVLLIYPSKFRVTGLPIGLTSISAVLKQEGHEVKIFDTTFYELDSQVSEPQLRADMLMSKRITDEDKWLYKNNSDMKEDLISLIHDFKPRVVGISILEPNYGISLLLSRLIKSTFKDILIVAGGVFPTLSPEVVISEDSIDIVCLGEGETSVKELCNKIAGNEPYIHVDGLWIKDKTNIYRNKNTCLHNLNELPFPDFSDLDERLFYKPMQGKLFKMVNIETSRGCPYICSYCAAPKLKMFYRENTDSSYYREMKMEKVFEQIHYQIDRHSPEFLYFSSETFLAMDDRDFAAFIHGYKAIRLPFWFQTRFETIIEERLQALKDVGMYWLTIGVEHGNEEFRRKVLKRHYSNESMVKAAHILKKIGIGASLNNIIGFPFENRDLIFDTIRLNKQLWQINNKLEINVFLFTPYRGCELYDICKENNLLSDRLEFGTGVLSDESLLNFSDEYRQELKGLLKAFNMYVKLPEQLYPDIKIAENPDAEGAAMREALAKQLQSH